MPSGVKRTHDEFILLFEKNNSSSRNIEIVGHYETNKTPIECICRVCGYHWSPTPKSLLNNHGCPKCANNVSLSHLEFTQLVKSQNPKSSSIELVGKYQSMTKKIKCRCLVCAYEWNARCGDLVYSQSGCPRCSGNVEFSNERFMADVLSHNPNAKDIEFLSTYSGSTKRISCRCKICGHEWNPLASSLSQGTGCPRCAKKRIAIISREQLKSLPKPLPDTHDVFLSKFLIKNPHSENIVIIGQYSGAKDLIRCRCKKCNNEWEAIASSLLAGSGCPNCSHSSTSFMEQFLATAFSFALPHSIIIERDRKTIGKELDILVHEYNFAIEIGSWRWHKTSYENDLSKQNLCREKGIRLIIIYDMCSDVLPEMDDVYCYRIDLGAENKHQSLKLLVEKLLDIIDVKHSFTDDEWEYITQLSYEKSQRIDHDGFMEKFCQNNASANSIEILSPYTRAVDKIKCKCVICNHIWETAATELIRGSGCPKCRIKEVGQKKSKKHIIQEWRAKNPSGSKLRCEKETGISRMTVYKWWDSVE